MYHYQVNNKKDQNLICKIVLVNNNNEVELILQLKFNQVTVQKFINLLKRTVFYS